MKYVIRTSAPYVHATYIGAGEGLGFETAKVLLTNKHPVIVAAKNLSQAEAAVEKLRSETSRTAIVQPLEMDMASSKSILAAVEELKKTWDQKIGVLVNNAGVADLDREWTQASWDKVMDVNLKGPLELTEQLLPVLAEGGRVVMVSSSLGKLHHKLFPGDIWRSRVEAAQSLSDIRAVEFDPRETVAKEMAAEGVNDAYSINSPAYSISKALLNKGVRALAVDERLTSRNLSIFAFCPGWCRTTMGTDQATDTPEAGGTRIAWAVQHTDVQELHGKFWAARGKKDSHDMEGMEYEWAGS